MGKLCIMQKIKQDKSFRPYMKEIAKEVQFLIKNSQILRQNLIQLNEQHQILIECSPLVKSKYIDVQFEIFQSADSNISDPGKKAEFARPMRPAIYIE